MITRTTTGGVMRGALVLAALGLACGPGAPGADTGEASTGAAGSDGSSEPTGAPPTTATVTTADSEATTPTSDGTDGGDETGTPPAACPPGPSTPQRLSNLQYINTLTDLFPGVDLPPLDLLPNNAVEGFENIADANPDHPDLLAKFGAAADAVATAATQQGGPWLPCPPDGGADPEACGHAVLPGLVARMFRRPLTAEEETDLLAHFDGQLQEGSFAGALHLELATRLASDEFLHLRNTGGTPVEGQPGVLARDGFDMAARMAYFLWDTTPDAPLLALAAGGGLDTAEGIAAQVAAMQADPRAAAGLARFARQWLYLHALDDAAGLPENLPPELQEPLRLDIDRFVVGVLHDGEGTLAALLTSPVAFVTPWTANFYDVAQKEAQVELDPERRPGLLTRVGWLALRSTSTHHSPFKRGWKLADSLLCSQLPPPPPDVEATLPDDPGPDATTRQLYDTILAQPQCAGCHEPMHRIGYGFEHYDLFGAWQDQEKMQAVDASGEVSAFFGSDIGGPFEGAAELTARLAGSRSVHDCVTRKTLMYALGRTLADIDACTLESLQAQFFAGGGDFEALQAAIILSDGFRRRAE
ncbi:MAG TPA: DUF1592 domain-containing protein [Nannocystis sp.]